MIDAAPCHVECDMQQAVNAAEVDERTVIGDVLDNSLEAATWPSSRLLHHLRSAARLRLSFEHAGAAATRRCCRGGDPS